MNRSSIFKKIIDFDQSFGSYLHDKRSGSKYLDFFGQYSTLVLGYNHPVFKTSEFYKDLKKIAHQKIPNCEIGSEESFEFDEAFRNLTSDNHFEFYHYCCTGALAIEAAIKTALDYKGCSSQRIITFKGNFHGINSYGGILTDRFEPVIQRVKGFPGSYWEPITNPIIEYRDGKKFENLEHVNKTLNQIGKILSDDKDVCAILVEPIQCTFGDQYFPLTFFEGIRDLATKYDVPLIFDEIQTGFGGTGKIWYYQHLTIKPDILAFGKKTQLSGIAVSPNYAKIFEKPIRLEVTWDADIIDMIRCKFIMKTFKKDNILDNVLLMNERLMLGLEKFDKIKNLRSSGLLFAFDFENESIRNKFVKELYSENMLCNPTRNHTVRLRPNLSVSPSEVDHAITIITKALSKC